MICNSLLVVVCLCFATVANAATLQALLDQRCYDVNEGTASPVTLLKGINLRVGLYSGEQASCVEPAGQNLYCDVIWSEITQAQNNVSCVGQDKNGNCAHIWDGWDIKLLDELAKIGSFTYTIVNMGRATYNSNTLAYQLPSTDSRTLVVVGGKYAGSSVGLDFNFARGGYTATAMQALGLLPINPTCGIDSTSEYHNGSVNPNPTTCQYTTDAAAATFTKVDVIGQGTWRVNNERTNWAVWSGPVLSEDVQFLTRLKIPILPTTAERLSLFLEPFSTQSWIVLIIVTVVTMLLIVGLADRNVGKGSEVSRAGICYYSFVSLFGAADLDYAMHRIKNITLGWMFFAILVFEFYVCNLTAILTKPVAFQPYLVNMEQLMQEQRNFCVQKGAANAGYFATHPTYSRIHSNITYRNSVADQFVGVYNGECSAAEVTQEDFYKWVDENKDTYPDALDVIGLVGQPIVIRPRGMMTSLDRSCVTTAINALFHRLAVRQSGGGCVEGEICDAKELVEAVFIKPPTVLQGTEAVPKLELSNFIGAFIVLVIVTIFGFGADWTANTFPHNPCIAPLILSEEGRTEQASFNRGTRKVKRRRPE